MLATKPKGIDLILDPHGKPEVYQGIYEITGDNLSICVSLPGEMRPEEFAAKAGSKRVLLILRRPPAKNANAGVLPGHSESVAKGLGWLVQQQHKDGYWIDANGKHTVTMTSLAGIALGMEGSIYENGKHAENIKRATNWLLRQSKDAKPHVGLIGDPNSPEYMPAHGYALRTQEKDGNWKDSDFDLGPVYASALHLTVLQLDNTPISLSR